MVGHVIDVVLNGTTHRQDAAAIVRADAVERLVRQRPQHAGELAAPISNSVSTSSSDCSCNASRRHIRRLVGVEQRGICPRSASASSGRSQWNRCPPSESPARGSTSQPGPGLGGQVRRTQPGDHWRSRDPHASKLLDQMPVHRNPLLMRYPAPERACSAHTTCFRAKRSLDR